MCVMHTMVMFVYEMNATFWGIATGCVGFSCEIDLVVMEYTCVTTVVWKSEKKS